MPAEIQNEILDAAGPFTKFVNGLLLAAELRGLPKRLREQVWQDASDTDWQGDVGVLPRFDISSKSLNLRSRSLLRRCKHMNLDKEIVHVAVRNGWDDPLDFGKPDELARIAAIEGNTRLMRDLIEERQSAKPDFSVVAHAACGGHLDAVHFLEGHLSRKNWPVDAGYHASSSGNLDLVVWLHERHPECLGESAYEGAAKGNHMHIVRWLADSGYDQCSSQAVQHALQKNNLHMVEFLVSLFPDTLDVRLPAGSYVASEKSVIEWLDARGLIHPRSLVRHVAKECNRDTLDWVLARFQTDLRECDLDEAHRQCDSDLLKHFYGRGMPLIRESVESAVRCCNVALLDWAVKRDRDVIPKLILQTACYGDPALIEWWRVKHGITFSQRELEFAISSRNIRFAVVLLATDDNKWDLEAADKAMFGVRENWCGLDSDSEDERQDEEFRKQILQAIGLVAARRDAQAV
ncbi:hypothetical protein HK105_207957 [Polyrhizophydium stewartii]|uniref:Ankyrin repeat protein n=1 Tax=Polyrhizophydium stewartii TaxID=2732419 RepID=A0ABR4MZA5_9FUNG